MDNDWIVIGQLYHFALEVMGVWGIFRWLVVTPTDVSGLNKFGRKSLAYK